MLVDRPPAGLAKCFISPAASLKDSYDRCIQPGLGWTYGQPPDTESMVSDGASATHKCFRTQSYLSSLQGFPISPVGHHQPILTDSTMSISTYTGKGG